ncbi:hypothetical protein GGD83_002893 [Rhodoblastus sphagnicola]|uniref:hypothetical protein n=1 Tax=Rhodoblastus sphagnicola TaxID=333368 RepID=UPI00185086A1|nr:hypothetical protein [Rhodoblastus sphagnicola]MBB4199082.1 hypothetical protein [Rhodoblastus sphagnicola]
MSYLDFSTPALCPVLALNPSAADLRSWCAAQRNLDSATTRTAQLVAAMRAITALVAQCKAVAATPDELSAMLEMLTQNAETILAHLDAVASQAV